MANLLFSLLPCRTFSKLHVQTRFFRITCLLFLNWHGILLFFFLTCLLWLVSYMANPQFSFHHATLNYTLHVESTILIPPRHTQPHPTWQIHNSHSTTPYSTTPYMADSQFSFHHATLSYTLHGRFTIFIPPRPSHHKIHRNSTETSQT